tara:strand:+ start:13951 stop:15321 length:1371 start_codon:yes stop_codon:yes gene_type:complete
MNKIRENKIKFSLILISLGILFSSLTILSLPSLFNFNKKALIIEKNFYKNFKLYLNTSGNISYKPFPKPHLLVENSKINLSKTYENDGLLNIKNLKIYISLKDIYLRKLQNFSATEISDSNIELEVSEIIELREHLYKKVNNTIIINNSKFFLRNKNKEVILISPIKKITNKINNKTKVKNLLIEGKVFGLNFRSDWKRNYNNPNTSLHTIDFFNPNIEIKNKYIFENSEKFKILTSISILQDKLEYSLNNDNGVINLFSPSDKKNINFKIKSIIKLNPFYFDGSLLIKKKKIEHIIDYILVNLLLYDEDILGNINGNFLLKFQDINNKLLKNGEISLSINERKINFKKINFDLDKIGDLVSQIDIIESQGSIKFYSKNQLNIKNHIEFAKRFQVSSKKVKKIEQINFDMEREVGKSDFILKNVKVNNINEPDKFNEIFFVKNIQNLRAHIRKIVD